MAKSLTQEELADRAFLTKGFISQIERDITSPSISTLKDIIDVLGVELAEFFKDVSQRREVYKRKTRILTSSSTDTCKVEILVADVKNHLMDPVLVTLSPGEKTPLESSHEGEEFGIVLKGTISLTLDKLTYQLSKEDCFYFSSHKEHYVENIGKGEAKILWIVSPPMF